MLQLLRSLGFARDAAPSGRGTIHDRVHAELASLGEERVEYLAAFAGLLARAAFADAEISAEEEQAMVERLRAQAGLEPHEAELVAAIARSATELLGDVENYLLTRSFNDVASLEQKETLLDCLYAVAGADRLVSVAEDDEIKQIGKALLVPHARVMDIRLRYRDRLAVLKNLPPRA